MKIQVAIVDDHQLFVDGIKSILSTEMDVEIVAEATDAITMMNTIEAGVEIDVLLSDIRMPGMNGLAFTRLMKEKYPAIPILIISMLDQSADVRDVLKSGAKGYIPKNIAKDELILAIRTVASGLTYYGKDYQNLLRINDAKEPTRGSVKLTRREVEILTCIARGRTSNEISEELHISKLTVDTHRKNIHKKLQLENQSELFKYAIEHFS